LKVFTEAMTVPHSLPVPYLLSVTCNNKFKPARYISFCKTAQEW
jgi:hypothetical protein